MGSGARLRSANQAFGYADSRIAFLLTAAPPTPPIVYQRVAAEWELVNAAHNIIPSDICADRNPPDPTPGPSRPDLGNWTATSRFQLITQCFIRDFSPGFAMRLVLNAGDPDEELMAFDLTLNGYPWQAFSDYPSQFPSIANQVRCWAVLPSSAALPRGCAKDGPFGPYQNTSSVRGFNHIFNIEHWDGDTLPTSFGRNLSVDIPLQAAVPITGFASVGGFTTVTSPGHGLICGCSVRIFDAAEPVNEITVRIHAITTDTFQWWEADYGVWGGQATAQWQPAYGAVIPHTGRC